MAILVGTFEQGQLRCLRQHLEKAANNVLLICTGSIAENSSRDARELCTLEDGPRLANIRLIQLVFLTRGQSGNYIRECCCQCSVHYFEPENEASAEATSAFVAATLFAPVVV